MPICWTCTTVSMGHGAVFESRLAAFRIYMDNRQSIDLYGKTSYRLEMDSTGFYTTPEQLAQGYGCDILWAGQSVGAGSFQGYQNDKPCYIDTVAWRRQTILADGPVRTVVEVADGGWIYHGQTLHMTQRYTLCRTPRRGGGHPHRRRFAGRDLLHGHTKTGTPLHRLHAGRRPLQQLGNNVPEKSTPEHDEWVGLGLYTDKACRRK